MGRSRGGLTTKIHALVDAGGLPIALKLTKGQVHDGRSGCDMLDALIEGDSAVGGPASMYPAFDWSVLCSWPPWISAHMQWLAAVGR
jgi:transposase